MTDFPELSQRADDARRAARRAERIVRRARRQVAVRDLLDFGLAGFGKIAVAVGAVLLALIQPGRRARTSSPPSANAADTAPPSEEES